MSCSWLPAAQYLGFPSTMHAHTCTHVLPATWCRQACRAPMHTQAAPRAAPRHHSNPRAVPAHSPAPTHSPAPRHSAAAIAHMCACVCNSSVQSLAGQEVCAHGQQHNAWGHMVPGTAVPKDLLTVLLCSSPGDSTQLMCRVGDTAPKSHCGEGHGVR